jgi:hypothetical protein
MCHVERLFVIMRWLVSSSGSLFNGRTNIYEQLKDVCSSVSYDPITLLINLGESAFVAQYDTGKRGAADLTKLLEQTAKIC